MSASKPPPLTPQPKDPLDEALEETFPASDPIAIEPEEPTPSDDAKRKGREGGHHHHSGKH